MCQLDSSILGKKNLFTVFALFFIAVLAIGGCNEGNNGGGNNGGGVGAPGPDTSACMVMSEPCSLINPTVGTVECVLSDTTCVVDLDDVITQLQGENFKVTDSSILYVGVWGGNGGAANENGGKASPGGYAQTTTTVSDIVNLNNGSSILYYFLGHAGTTGGNHCGGAGGAATLVTFEDLSLSPATAPTEDEIFMLAGGGGGASGGTIKNCPNKDGVEGGRGGIIIAPESATQGLHYGPGAGCNGSPTGCGSGVCGDCVGNLEDSDVLVAEGGSGSEIGTGGKRTCCLSNLSGSQSGFSGIGGIGGLGGNGKDCTGPGNTGFINASLSFGGAGSGGAGGGGGNKCTNGGGGGGGGYAGGGGGGHGNGDQKAQAGGGGGSAAMNSTQDTSSSPTSIQANACNTASGCVAITFIED